MADPNDNKEVQFPASEISHGVCAPRPVMTDRRVLLPTPMYATLPFYVSSVTATGIASTVRSTWTLFAEGITETGTNAGYSVALTAQETGASEGGFGHPDFPFLIKGVSVMPDGYPTRVRAAVTPASDAYVNDPTGAALAGGNIMAFADEDQDIFTNWFFQSHTLSLTLAGETCTFELAYPAQWNADQGIHGGASAQNGYPLRGAYRQLPFYVKAPSGIKRNKNTRIVVTRNRALTAVLDSATHTADATFCQQFKVILHGRLLCLDDDITSEDGRQVFDASNMSATQIQQMQQALTLIAQRQQGK